MKKFVVISPELIWVASGQGQLITLDELEQHVDPKGAALFAVVPQVARVVASERTIDSVMQQQFPGENSFRAEPLESNVFQVYVAPDALLARLRAATRTAYVVPYPAAVRHVVSLLHSQAENSLRERTRVFLASIAADISAVSAPERVAVDVIGDDFVFTVLKGKEIVAVRHVRGGEPATELQRTLAANRMADPLILTRDHDFALELRAQGYNAQLSEADGALIGISGLEKVVTLRFLTDVEVAREKARDSRRRALMVAAISMATLAVAGGVFAYYKNELAKQDARTRRLTEERDQRVRQLSELYQERYASIARSQSVQIREELFDLSTSLPPQVVLLSVEREGAAGLTAVVERRPGAAPFSRSDLVSALATSPYFAKAQIKEQYEGHVVRYVLNVPPATPAPPAATP